MMHRQQRPRRPWQGPWETACCRKAAWRSDMRRAPARSTMANDIVQKGKHRFATGAEIPAEAEMDPGKEAVPDITPQILAAQPASPPVICVNRPTTGSADKLDHDRRSTSPKPTAMSDGIAQRLPVPAQACPRRYSAHRAPTRWTAWKTAPGIRKLMIFSTMPTAAASVSPRLVGEDGDDE